MPLVLIVEDDEETLRMMRVLLTSWGYDAACARNGAEALEQMRQQRPCLVLLDMHMPVMAALNSDGGNSPTLSWHRCQSFVSPRITSQSK